MPNRQGANRHSLAPDEDDVSGAEGKGTVKVRKENVRVFSKNCNLVLHTCTTYLYDFAGGRPLTILHLSNFVFTVLLVHYT